tara:strand:+ start:1676 stop:1969 length:294 start_codon:yes stop_codon:yes gene_type:complete
MFFVNQVEACLNAGRIFFPCLTNKESCIGMCFHSQQRCAVSIDGFINAELVTINDHGLGKVDGVTREQKIRTTTSKLLPVGKKPDFRVSDFKNTIVK